MAAPPRGNIGPQPVLWSTWDRDGTARCTLGSVYRSIMGSSMRRNHPAVRQRPPRCPKCWLAILAALPALLTTCHARCLEVGPLAEHGCDASASAQQATAVVITVGIQRGLTQPASPRL